MKYRITTKIYDGETVCGPCKIESIMESEIAALCAFEGIDPIMINLMKNLEEAEGSDRMKDIKIVTEIGDGYGDGWEDIQPGDKIFQRKVLTYKEYSWMMSRELENA